MYETFQGPLELCELPDPASPKDGVVIEVKSSGICRSDWHGWMGHDSDIQLPHVPGHELAGTVLETGPEVSKWTPGDRVTVPFSVGCGQCPQCATGNHQICDCYFQPGFTAWGSFAERVAIPHADLNLVRLPESFDFVSAASLGCRFITSYRAVTAQGNLQPGQWLVVVGCGGVGLSAIMIANSLGAQTIGVDIQADALSLASSIGATHVIDATQHDDVAANVVDLTAGGAHVSLDALGSRSACRTAIRSLRKSGRHVQVGLMSGADLATELPLDQVIAKEIQIIGSHGMSAQAYAPMLDMIQSGQLQPQRLVTQVVSLKDVVHLLPAIHENRHHGVTVVSL
jgi:alcohol dehydrogenase